MSFSFPQPCMIILFVCLVYNWEYFVNFQRKITCLCFFYIDIYVHIYVYVLDQTVSLLNGVFFAFFPTVRSKLYYLFVPIHFILRIFFFLLQNSCIPNKQHTFGFLDDYNICFWLEWIFLQQYMLISDFWTLWIKLAKCCIWYSCF